MTQFQSQFPLDQNLPLHYSGRYKGSFAYLTIKDRLPVILVKVVDFLCQNRTSIAETNKELINNDIKEVIGRLSALQNEMVTNKLIKPLIYDSSDVCIWNDYLKKLEDMHGPPAWFETSWLFAECYFYRRIKQAFELSSKLKDLDPFHKQKEDSFLSVMDAVGILSSSLHQTLSELQNQHKCVFHLFRRYLEISLWGNKWDLSISAGKENIEQSNPLSQLEKLRENIIANDTELVWQILQDANKTSEEVTLDFVLDNAGFELFCDLCFMQFLLAAKLVKKIRIYVKTIPWFVSDTLNHDISWLLHTLAQSDNENLVNFSKECSERIKSNELLIIEDEFWTLPHDYSEMNSIEPELYDNMGKSDLVVFKGDLNYRKLTGDRQWEETTSFKDALSGFLPTSVVSLRTIKADVIVGLKSGTSALLSLKSQNWKFSGDFAVIQSVQKCLNSI